MNVTGLLLLWALEQPEILAMRCEPVAGGAVLKLLATASVGARTTRTSDGFRFEIPALAGATLVLPEPIPPLRSLKLERTQAGLNLLVGTADGTVAEAQVEGSLVVLQFQSREAAQPAAKPDVEKLFPLLFPTAAPEAQPEEQSRDDASEVAARSGWRVGPLTISPSLTLRYVDGDSTFLDTPQPVRVRYLEIQPRLGISSGASVAGGQLSLAYEPRFRTGENRVPVLKQPSHFLSAGFERPLGSLLRVSITDQFGRGSIETEVLDPGREYFYDITAFTRNQVSLALRTAAENRMSFGIGATRATEHVDSGGGYFSNERREAHVSMRYELGVSRHLTLGYSLERTPPPASRPIAEMRAHSVSLGVDGQLGSLTTATASVGYRAQEHPQAAEPGRSFKGLALGGTLQRDFPGRALLTLTASRAAQLSAFESNAFYLANGASAALTLTLPGDVQLIAGASHQRNSYRLAATGLGLPRHDRLSGWTVGVGRTLTRFSYLRADYNWQDRRSNVVAFSARTHSLVVQLGIRPGTRPASGS